MGQGFQWSATKLLGAGAAGVALLVAVGCGSAGSVSTSALGSAAKAATKRDATAYATCRNDVGRLMRAELALEAHLAGGPNHRQYVRDTQVVSFAAQTVPIPSLNRACFLLDRHSFYALDDYREAAQLWSSCLRSAAGCDYGSIRPRLRAIWTKAARQAGEARAGLRGLLHGA